MVIDTDSSTEGKQVNSKTKKQASESPCRTKMEQKNNKITKVYNIGLAVFSSEIKRREYLRLLNGNVCEQLQKDIWQLRGPDANKKSSWPQIFRLMQQTYIKELHFQKNPQILKEIQAINFSSLKELNLFAGNIENYEAFAFLNVPKLEKINLIYNQCPNFKALNKVHMPSLRIICIYIRHMRLRALDEPEWNYNFSIKDFERWGFQLNELRLEKTSHDRIMLQDLSRLAKAKPSLKDVYICPVSRIKNVKALRTIGEGKQIRYLAFIQNLNDFHEIHIRDGSSRIYL